MTRVLTIMALALIALAVAVFALWSTLALGHRLPAPGWLRMAGAGAAGLAGIATIALLFTPQRWWALAAYSVLALSILGWWSTIRPPAVANFADDVARQVTGRIDGDRLTLENVRNFTWRTAEEAEPRWENRTYDLGALRDLDLFLSHWDDSGIAHMIMSFGFADGRWLAWSVEVRRLKGSVYSPISGLFKTDPVVLIAAEEMDVVGVRTNLRGEDVFRYRLNLRPETVRTVLTQYVTQANRLSVRPAWYHTLTTNCTTGVVTMMRAVGATVPLDWRLVLNGRLPEYAYDHDALEAGLTLAQAKAKAPVSARAKAHGLREGFSSAIR
jgi:hypothetical protein